MIARLMFAVALATTAVTVTALPDAAAQPAAAIGKPLPDPSLRDGVLMVRVIGADRATPVTGADVTLKLTSPDGQGAPIERTARTDAEGRASFADIAMGTLVQARIVGVDDAQVTSSQFPMPQSGGVRVMLSTKPTAADAPMTGPGGAGGPPMSPRAMSGQPRPEANDPRDTVTVRLSYDDFADAPVASVPVVIVGYRHDQLVSGKVIVSDASGRAELGGLDTRGATTYFAMTLLPRNGSFDRLASIPILLDGEAGVRLMLSGEKRASTAAPVDDLARLDEQPKQRPVPAGVVRVQFAGVPEPGSRVELIDALTGTPVASTEMVATLPQLDSLRATATAPVTDPALAAGALTLTFTHDGQPLIGRVVTVQPSTPGAAPLTATTDAGGVATVVGVPAGALTATITVDPDAQVGATLTMLATGARSAVDVAWTSRGEAGARFAGVATAPDRAYAVRATMHKQVYLSAPFQLSPDRGVAITVLVMPRIMMQWSLSSWLDDVYFGVRGTFGIRNASWAPYLAGTDAAPEELTIPLPSGFTGAVVRDDFQAQVGIDPAKGFVLRRPIPPGGMQFVAGFSLKVDQGTVKWSMPLPIGTFDSGIEIKRAGNSRVVLPPDVNLKVEEAGDDRGRYFVLSPITILPGKSMNFEIRDLPHEASWRRHGRIVAGLVVLSLLIAGTTLALLRPRPASLPTARFSALLDELAALEAAGGATVDPARREALMAELEALSRAKPQ